MAIIGNSAGDSIQTASVVGIPASWTPADRRTVTHARPNAAEARTAPDAVRSVSSRSDNALQTTYVVASTIAGVSIQRVIQTITFSRNSHRACDPTPRYPTITSGTSTTP